MASLGQYLAAYRIMAAHAFGNVLEIGLGFGEMHRELHKNPAVANITVIEPFQDVVDAYLPTPHHHEVILKPYQEVVATHQYQTVFYDAWGEEGDIYDPYHVHSFLAPNGLFMRLRVDANYLGGVAEIIPNAFRARD